MITGLANGAGLGQRPELSGPGRKFVGVTSVARRWVVEGEAAGAVAGVFGGADGVAAGQDRVFLSVLAGQVDLAFPHNRTFARLYMPFDPLAFFADAGNGISSRS